MAWRRDGPGMMGGCLKVAGLCAGILLLATFPLAAMDVKGHAELGLEKMGGQTSYEIGGLIAVSGEENRSAHFPFSKLEFPLAGWLLATEVGLQLGDTLQASLGLKKSMIRDADTVKDWDWGYWYLAGRPWARAGSLDIYSTSRAKADIWMADARARWCLDLLKNRRPQGLAAAQLRIGAGYMVQVLDYDAVDNLDQWYPSYPLYEDEIENDPKIKPALKQAVKGHVYNAGDVLRYRVEYQIPFLEGGVMLGVTERLRLQSSLAYSWWVKARDTDHHLLRSKVSRGRCDGRAVLFALNTDYSLRENLALGLSFRRIIITTTGRQHQSAPDFSASVDQHIDSDQRYFGSTVGYRF